MQAHALLTMIISSPLGSGNRQRSTNSARSWPPAATVVARRVCATPAALRARSGCGCAAAATGFRSVELWNTSTGSAAVDPMTSVTRHAGRRCSRVRRPRRPGLRRRRRRPWRAEPSVCNHDRRGAEPAGDGPDRRSEIAEVEIETVSVLFRLVLATVDDHEPGRRSTSSGKPNSSAKTVICGDQVTLLRRRGDAVAHHRAEDRLPVGVQFLSPSVSPGTRLTSLPSGSVCQTPYGPDPSTKARRQPPRPAAPASRWIRFCSGERSSTPGSESLRRAAIASNATAVLSRSVVERTPPEPPHPGRVRGLEHDARIAGTRQGSR